MNQSDKKLIEMYKTLPNRIKPPRDLWSGIDKKLKNKFNFNDIILNFLLGIKESLFLKKHILTYSFLVIAVFIFGIFLFVNINNQNKKDYQYSLVEKELQDIILDYEKACSKITKLIKDKKEFFNEETILSIQTNMSLMDETINEIKIAIKNDPNNYELVTSLTKIYFEETYLLFKTGDLIKNYDKNSKIEEKL